MDAFTIGSTQNLSFDQLSALQGFNPDELQSILSSLTFLDENEKEEITNFIQGLNPFTNFDQSFYQSYKNSPLSSEAIEAQLIEASTQTGRRGRRPLPFFINKKEIRRWRSSRPTDFYLREKRITYILHKDEKSMFPQAIFCNKVFAKLFSKSVKILFVTN